jgi:hypothetical protein
VYPPNVARQRLSKKVTAATNIHTTIEELLEASFSMRSVSYGRKVGDQFVPELLAFITDLWTVQQYFNSQDSSISTVTIGISRLEFPPGATVCSPSHGVHLPIYNEPALGKLINVQLCKEFPAFSWNRKVHYRVRKCPPLFPVLNHMNPVHNLPSYFFKMHFNIVTI